MDLLAPHQGVTGVARPAVTDALVVLGHAAGIDSAAVHTGVFTVEVREAGLGDVAVFVLEALDLLAAFPLVIWVADVQAVGTGALGKVVVDHAHSPGRALEELAAVLTPALAVSLVELADFVWMRAVGVVDALWFRDLLAASSAVRISSVALSAAATTLVVERNTVCVRRAAETDANLGALHDANSVGNAGRGCRTARVVAAFVVLPLDAAEHVFSVSNKAMSALAFVRVLPWNTHTVGPALVELASIEAPLAACVVGPTNIGEPPAVFVDLAFVLWAASVNWVVWVSLVVLQTVARWPVVVYTAHGIGATLFPFAGIDALATVGTDLVRSTLIIRGAAFSDGLSWQASNVRIEGVSLCSGRARTLSLVVHSRAERIGCALFVHAHRDAFPQASRVRSTDEVFPAVDVNLAFVRNVAAPDEWVPNQARFADTSRPVVHRLTDGPAGTVVTVASIVAVVLAVKHPLADGNRRAIVVPVASLGLAVTSVFSVVRVSDKVLSALADGDVVFSVTNAVLTTQRGGAARKTTLDAVAVNRTDLVVPTVTAGTALRNRGTAVPNVVGEALEPGSALAAGLVMDRDTVGVWTAAPVPARVCAIPDAGTRQQAHGRLGTIVVVLAQVPHAASPKVVGIAGKPGKTLASGQVVHGDAVGVRSALIVEAKLDAVLDSYGRHLANLVALAVNVAVAPVTSYGHAALSQVAGVSVVASLTFAHWSVKPSDAVGVGTAAGLDASPGAVLDASRVGQAAIALGTIGVLHANVEQRLTAPDAVVGIAQEGVAADACGGVLLPHALGVGSAGVSQADIDTLVASRLVPTGLVLEAVTVNGTVVWHLAAGAVVDEARETLADGLVVFSQADRIFAAGLVFADISALLHTLNAKLALEALATVLVFKALVLWFC